ncbi:hypothetical protein [Sphingobium sp. ZW T5_29]|uniref:hypothetical protein n=1 Tax=Sphingobium sp. ZW T5_29 TaxID=3378077 RepID=UPI003852A936
MQTAFPDVKPWPKQAEPAPAAVAEIGHNRPPMDVEARADFDEKLALSKANREKIAQLVASADRAVAVDEDSLGKCGELVKQIRAAESVVSSTHQDVKAPYLAAGRAVDEAKNELVTQLSGAKALVEGKQKAFLREAQAKRDAEARRIREAQELVDRERREQEAAAAAAGQRAPEPEPVYAPPPPSARIEPIRGDFGATVSTTKKKLCEVTDYTLAFMKVEKNAKVREAIDKAIAALVRAGEHEIDGVRIWDDIAVSNR